MNRPSVVFVVTLCVIAVAASIAPSATSPASRPTIVLLLDRYAAHDFEAPMALVHSSSDDAAKIADEIDATGSAWTSARGARETPARRLVAATFVLDLARVWSVRPFDGRRWLASRRILAWGCAELRKNATPLAGERWWHLAAVGLFEGREDVPALIGNEVPAPIPNSTLIDGARGHLPHALARFPQEPRFRLAQAVAREISTWRVGSEARILREGRLVDAITPPPRDGVLPPEITPEFVAALTEAAGPIKSPRDRQLRLLVDAGANQLARLAVLRESPRLFEALFEVEPVAGEARLRYGYTALRLGDTVNGLTQLRHAEALLSDPVLVYLTRIYLGSAYERQDQPSEAAAAYRRALEVMPGARTASLALTSLLIRDSRVADAYDAAEQLLSQPNAIDPASRYRTGDYRLVFDWLEQLKKVLP